MGLPILACSDCLICATIICRRFVIDTDMSASLIMIDFASLQNMAGMMFHVSSG